MGAKAKYLYIGERRNPQFKKPYYVVYGRISQAEAKQRGEPKYGAMIMHKYETQQAFDDRVTELKTMGLDVTQW